MISAHLENGCPTLIGLLILNLLLAFGLWLVVIRPGLLNVREQQTTQGTSVPEVAEETQDLSPAYLCHANPWFVHPWFM